MTNELTKQDGGTVDRYNDETMLNTLRETVCKGATIPQFRMFIEVCKGDRTKPIFEGNLVCAGCRRYGGA